MQEEIVFCWVTGKRSMSNQVSLCPGMRFSIGFPITFKEPQMLHWAQLEYELCTLYLPSKLETSPSPVTMVKSQGNFSVTTAPLTKMQLEKKGIKKKKKKKIMDFDYYEEYLTIISTIMAVLRKANFYLVDICKKKINKKN